MKSAFLMLLTFLSLALGHAAVAKQEADLDSAATSASTVNTTIEFRIAENEPGEGLVEATIGGTQEQIFLKKTPILSREDLAYGRVVVSGHSDGVSQPPSVETVFTEAGVKKISTMTSENLGKRLTIVVDGKVVSAPRIVDRISANKAVISGNFSQGEAQRIADSISPAKFQASLLLLKSDWSKVDAAKEITADLRLALSDASVPQALLDKLPQSGPVILFPTKIMSLYTPQHDVELLAWLKEKGLVESVEAFPPHRSRPLLNRTESWAGAWEVGWRI